VRIMGEVPKSPMAQESTLRINGPSQVRPLGEFAEAAQRRVIQVSHTPMCIEIYLYFPFQGETDALGDSRVCQSLAQQSLGKVCSCKLEAQSTWPAELGPILWPL